jgi:hypothetical protein
MISTGPAVALADSLPEVRVDVVHDVVVDHDPPAANFHSSGSCEAKGRKETSDHVRDPIALSAVIVVGTRELGKNTTKKRSGRRNADR